MKRITTLLIVLCLVSAASTTLAEGASAFAFRNGITWASTPDDVMTAEKDAGPSKLEASLQWITQVIEIPDAQVAGSPCYITYLFAGDRLAMVTCDYSVEYGGYYDAVYADLTAQYGDPDILDPTNFLSVVNAIGGMGYTAEEMEGYAGWTLPDGTRASISGYAEDAFMVAYENSALLDSLWSSMGEAP